MKNHSSQLRPAVACLVSIAALFMALPNSARATELQASDHTTGDSFGYSVSVSGDLGLIGAFTKNGSQGEAYLYSDLDTGNGAENRQFFDPLPTATPPGHDDLGVSVSLSGTHGLIGTEGKDTNRGAAYFYSDITATSTPDVVLTASDAAESDEFGEAVSLDGTTALIGAYQKNIFTGEAYVFRNLGRTGSAVTEDLRLVASDATIGTFFGSAVSLSGNLGLLGAFRQPVGMSATRQGAAYLYRNLNTATGDVNHTITQDLKLVASDGAEGDNFGTAVSISGTNALVGAPVATETYSRQGAVYLYRNLDTATGTGGVVTQTDKIVAFDSSVKDHFGVSVAISGNTGLIGADQKNSNTGAAYLIPDLSNSAVQVKLLASDGMGSDHFGISVSLDGDRFLIGAYAANNFAGKAYSGTVSSVTTLDLGNTSRTIDGLSFVSNIDWIVGQATSGNQVTLKEDNSADVTGSGKAIYIGKNAGSNNNTLLVQGTVTATTVNISAPSGSTGNTLEVTNTGSVSATTITVNSGGTLLLTGSGNHDRISNTTGITLAGGTIAKGSGASEGTTSAVGLGALTLTAASQIDFTATAGTLTFQSLTPGLNVLSIVGYIGNGSPGGFDQLIFAQNQSTQFSSFDFGFGAGVNVSEYALGGGFFEVYSLVPVPEPTTWIAGALAATSILIKCYRRRRRPGSACAALDR